MQHLNDILKQKDTPTVSIPSPVTGENGTTPHEDKEEAEKGRKIAYLSNMQKSMPPRYPDLQPDDHYLELMKEHKKSFLLTGGVGTGKTRKLLEVLLAYFIQKTQIHFTMGDTPNPISPVTVKKYFLTVTDVLRKIKDEFDHPATDGGIMERMIQADILFLDDLGAEKASEWVKEQLYTVINERYNWVRPVFLTTNLTIQEIAENYGDRFASRLVEMCEIVKVTGKDRRVEK